MVAASRYETSAAATETVCRAGLARRGDPSPKPIREPANLYGALSRVRVGGGTRTAQGIFVWHCAANPPTQVLGTAHTKLPG